MKRMLLTVLLTFCLVLAGCSLAKTPPDNAGDPPPADVSPTPIEPGPDTAEDPAKPVVLSSLTVELVTDWAKADELVASRTTLAQLLKDALLAQQYTVEQLTVTLSTAAGFTGEALSSGGVDLAFLTAMDFIQWESGARALLVTDEDICSGVIAVTSSRSELDEAFCQAWIKALTDTDKGREFLSLYVPENTYVLPSEEALQQVRDAVAALEKQENGGK